MLRTLGFTPARVISLIVYESLVLSVIGGFLGALSCYLVIALGGFNISIEGYQIAFSPSTEVLVSALVTAAAVGLFGGLLPAIDASMQNIVEGLRKV